MPAGRDLDDPSDPAPPRVSLWQRMVQVLPGHESEKSEKEKVALKDRLLSAIVKSETSDSKPKDSGVPDTVEGLEAAVKSANDKERLVGLLAAPFAALIGLLVIGAQISHDPPAYLKNGLVNKLHVNPSLYL